MQIGHMGRDVAAANNFLSFGHELHIVAEHENPDLMKAAQESGGRFYRVKDISCPKSISELAVNSDIELVYTNSDEALAANVIGEVHKACPDALLASPDKNGSRHEWDKFDSRLVIADIDPSYNPVYFTATSDKEVDEAVAYFKENNEEIAVKPKGLTGGKGVKVMGPHLQSFEDAEKYAKNVLKSSGHTGVMVEQKVTGYEFTIQAYTDGKTMIAPPVTYDYPYREDGDKGPGTGGMGCFTMAGGEQLPFLTDAEYQEATSVMKKVLQKLNEDGRDFKGVHYGSFFKTEEGLKVVEFNARMGDPEGMNIVELLEDDIDLAKVLENISKGELDESDVRFKRLASTVIYLVSPEYGYRFGGAHEFEVNLKGIESDDCKAYFVAAEQVNKNTYRSVGSSRTFAISALANTPWEARSMIHETIEDNIKGPLQFRHDIGKKQYIESLNI